MSTTLPHATGPTTSLDEDGVWSAQRPPFPGTEQLRAAEVFAGPGYQAPRPATDPVAAIALVLGLLSLLPGVGVLAAAAGWWALRRLRGSWAVGLSQAWFGVVAGCATTLVWLWAWWFFYAAQV